MNNSTILVCDDDREIVNAIGIYLIQEGYTVVKAYDGLQALEAIKANEIQLIIIDVMMPKMDGLTALIKLRETHKLPVIVLSAKSEDTDKIIGLNFGADDYVTKPFNPLELMARVRSNMRRYTDFGAAKSSPTSLRTGGLVLDTSSRCVRVDGVDVALTPTEFKIVNLLLSNLSVVMSSETIYEKVWEDMSFSVENTVAVHIRRIREKIEINPKEPKYIKVVWGVGYKMDKI
ncbi:MAG: response regulator transcription factor [Clostridia bacterium]|nr:response regulator transcription factor [Clostridia bacterium]